MRDDAIFVGGGGENYEAPQYLPFKYANRHGMISGATGTGKTVTLQIMAEELSANGVPVFLADVKGDLSGLAKAGSPDFKLHNAFVERANKIKFDDYGYDPFPVTFWDLFGEQGHPIRSTVSELGPLFLSRLLDLSEVQEGVLNIAFHIADEEGLLLLDLKDLRSMLVWLGENAADVALRYGNVTTQSIGAIQRRLLVLENQGANLFFGEPALNLEDMIQTDASGKGMINILAADKLMQSPRLYATFLLWLLSELFETMPEAGDPDKPKFVFFFDEAHLLFEDAPKALLDKIEQVARLIRSKGVGVFFISQSPRDVPDDILGQLGNRVQHALRAFTPRDLKAVRLASETFRANPAFKTDEVITQLGVGEALVSLLEAKGTPSVVERTLIRPPSSQLGPITEAERKSINDVSPFSGKYTTPIDRESAFEILQKRAEQAAKQEEEAISGPNLRIDFDEFNNARRYKPELEMRQRQAPRSSSRSDSIATVFAKSLARSLGSKAGRSLVRGVLGGVLRGR